MKRFILGVAVAAVIIFGAIALWTQRTGRPPHHEGTPATGEAPRFKFVVIADLTGGRPSDDTVFDEVISEINLVDPDFTLCVGDLIEGYSDSPQQVQAEWEVFNAEVGRLNRPFYYVFGNHDATTPVMIDILRDRFKNLYYAFDHKQCHFIVLYSDEGDPASGEKDFQKPELQRISTEQMTFLEEALRRGQDCHHQFV
ncbi:MAG TPA: metallophosphoesterase, partial [Planctomycetota bacterium]|nr:metallophosphoesterase [Planctomycetota bacterium]